ncbi:MAG: hypothetical protein ABIJ56_09155 [Pseudomonadota bacterium]
MGQVPKLDGVHSALNDLLSLEKERLGREEEERREMEEESVRRREDELRRKLEEAERRKREEEEARLAKERAEKEAQERKIRDRELEEIKLKKDLEMKQRLEQERLRMEHEQQLAAINARGRKGLPGWVMGVVAAVFVIGAAAAGIVLYKMNKDAELKEQARLALEESARDKDVQKRKQIEEMEKKLVLLQEKATLSARDREEGERLKRQIEKLEQEREEAAAAKGKIKNGKGHTKINGEKTTAEEKEFNLNDPIGDLADDSKSKKKKKKH